MPFFLIEQTNYCNLACATCPNRLNQRPKGFMTPDIFRNIVNQLLNYDKNAAHKCVVLHGFGELLLSPYLFENLEYLDRKRFDTVVFSTNGMLLMDEKIQKLKKHRCISWLTVSLNSAKKEAMEKINTGSNFEVVVDNVKNLIASKPRFRIFLQLMLCELTRTETKKDFVDLLGTGDFSFGIKRLHDYYSQVKDGLTDYRATCCLEGGRLLFGGILPKMHWDGDMVGCCGDDTKKQIYGNAIRDGIYNKKVQDKKLRYKQELKIRDFAHLPLCKECLEGGIKEKSSFKIDWLSMVMSTKFCRLFQRSYFHWLFK